MALLFHDSYDGGLVAKHLILDARLHGLIDILAALKSLICRKFDQGRGSLFTLDKFEVLQTEMQIDLVTCLLISLALEIKLDALELLFAHDLCLVDQLISV